MKRPALHRGSYTAGPRTLEYWTKCEHCRDQEACKKEHTCDHPGQIWFLMDGKRKVGWSGIITLKKIARTVRKYLEREELPAGVAVPFRQMRLEEATCP